MKKIEGEVFWKDKGEIKYHNSAFFIYCMLYHKCKIIIINFRLICPQNLFPLECFACVCNTSLMQNYNIQFPL